MGRQPRNCMGVITSNEKRERPLVRCREPSEEGSLYCGQHAQETERQDRLRSYLKKGWERGVIAGRGHEPSPVMLPPIEQAMRRNAAARDAPDEPEEYKDDELEDDDPLASHRSILDRYRRKY